VITEGFETGNATSSGMSFPEIEDFASVIGLCAQGLLVSFVLSEEFEGAC